MKPELVILDNDGVLVDSEIIGHRINAFEMTRLGFPITIEKSIELLTGISKDGFDRILLQEYGKVLPDTVLIKILDQIDEAISLQLEPIADIFQVMDYLEENNVSKCIATNGNQDYVIGTLTKTKLTKYFEDDQIFSASMVNYKGKPAPDIFLLAANHFKVKPQNCLVVEDSVLGIEAAKAANMPVIGFLGGSHAQNAWYHENLLRAKPTMIVKNAAELLDTLKKIC